MIYICIVFSFLGTITAIVFCDDISTVYGNGRHEGGQSGSPYMHLWSGHHDYPVKLLAIRCQNTGGFGGLLVSVGDDLVSDTSWRCSKSSSDISGKKWYSNDFDDTRSSWRPAHALGYNNGELRTIESDFKEYAQWIWYDSSNTHSETIYCRGWKGRTQGRTHYTFRAV